MRSDWLYLVCTVVLATAKIPTRPLSGGGTLPMLAMGGNDFAGWFKAAGKGAMIQTFHGQVYLYTIGTHVTIASLIIFQSYLKSTAKYYRMSLFIRHFLFSFLCIYYDDFPTSECIYEWRLLQVRQRPSPCASNRCFWACKRVPLHRHPVRLLWLRRTSRATHERIFGDGLHS